MPSVLGFLSSDKEKKELYREIYERDLKEALSFIAEIVEGLKALLKEVYSNLDKFDTNAAARIYRSLHELEFYLLKVGSDMPDELPSLDDDYIGEFPCVDALLCKASSVMRIATAQAKLCFHHREKSPSLIDDMGSRFKRVGESSKRLQKYITDVVIRSQVS